MGVGAGVGVAVGFGFGFGVGVAVGRTVGRGIGVAVGAAVDRAGVAIGARVAVGVGFSSTGVALGALNGVAVAVAAGVGVGLSVTTALTASVGVGELDWPGLPDVIGRTATMSMTRPMHPTTPTVPPREMVTRGSLRSTPVWALRDYHRWRQEQRCPASDWQAFHDTAAAIDAHAPRQPLV
jgi:hypothetical protein